MPKVQKMSLAKNFKKAYTGFAEQIVWTKEGQTVEGIYIKLKENVGKNKSKIFVLLKDDKYIAIWDSYQLTQAFSVIPFHSEVKIIFKGQVELEGTNKQIKNFEVQYCEPEENDNGEVGEITETETVGDGEKIPI